MAATIGFGVIEAGARPAREVTIGVTVRRFEFVPSRIEVTEGDQVILAVRSADGAHGIRIRSLKLKKDIPRGGAIVTIAFTAPAPGTYDIECSEYCGRGHDGMVATLVASPAGPEERR